MSVKKLDKGLEQSVMSAIEQIIDNSKHMPDTDLNKIAADVFENFDGMTPQLVKRACEAFNKSKSIHTLSKRASEDRGEDFPLIDSQAVVNKIFGYHKKEASANFEMPARTLQDNMLDMQQGMSKVASDWGHTVIEEDPRVLDRAIIRETEAVERGIAKVREKAFIHKQAGEDAIRRICQVVRRMHPKPMMKVARLAVNRYGDDGERLMKLVGAFTKTEFPLHKTAAAAIFPLEEPYTSLTIAIDEARAFKHFDSMLEKIAAIGDTWDTIKKNVSRGTEEAAAGAVLDTPGAVARAASTGIKGAASKLLDPVIDFAKSPVYQQLTKEVEVGKDGPFDASLRNRLSQLRATQAFVDVAADDFAKDYPIDDTVQAYNNVVGAMPELLDPKYGPWLKSLVRQQLVQGNVYDSATIKDLQAIGKEIQKGRIQSIDEATKALESKQGKTLSGIEVGGGDSAPAPSGGAPASSAVDVAEKETSRAKGKEDKPEGKGDANAELAAAKKKHKKDLNKINKLRARLGEAPLARP